jgi:hypothetical protein
MPRTTIDATLERRRLVESLHVRGAAPLAIAKELAADPRTVARDIRWLAAQWATETAVGAERHRLLASARRVEVESWTLYQKLGLDDASNKLGALGKVLAAQAQQTALLGAIETATLAAEVATLREQVTHLVGERGGVRLVGSGGA